MKFKVNTYIAALLITIVGVGAALLIVHVAASDTLTVTVSGSEAEYQSLKDSILNSR